MKYLIFLLFICLISCKSSDNTSKKDESNSKSVMSYKEIASNKLGEDVQFVMNKGETLVLCKKITTPKHIPMGMAGSNNISTGGASNIKLIVVNISKGTILFEKSIAYGSASWEDENQLRIVEITGVSSPNNPNIYLYNVLTGTRTQINNGKGEGDVIEKP